MPIRVRCPRCGQVNEYEPTEEDLRNARERSLSNIAFYHGDHILVVFFDANGSIRRTFILKSAKSLVEALRPGITISDLGSLIGDERLALALSVLIARGRLILVSSSTPLALEVFSLLRALVDHDVSVEIIEEPEGLKDLENRPPGIVFIMSQDLLTKAGDLGRAVVIDLEEREQPKLSRKERRSLKAILKVLKKARAQEREDLRIAFLNDKMKRFRELLERALKVFQEHERIGEPALVRKVDPKMSNEELDLLYFILEEFSGIDISRRVTKGPSELLGFWLLVK